MTFIPRARIESRAEELWQRHELTPGFDAERLLDDLGLDLLWEDVLDGEDGVVLGQLVPGRQLVVLNERHRDRLEENGGRQRRYTIGHEIGHWSRITLTRRPSTSANTRVPANRLPRPM